MIKRRPLLARAVRLIYLCLHADILKHWPIRASITLDVGLTAANLFGV